MRVVWLILLLVVASCSKPGESGEVPTSPSTTQPASPAESEPGTTATSTPTTSAEPECTEREGVLYNTRGFVCPPHMKPGRFFSDAIGYLPGTYTTHLFEPGFSFTQEAAFQSGGENLGLVAIEETSNRALYAFAPDPAGELLAFPFDSLPWVQDLVVSPVEYWGASGTQIDFTVNDCPAVGCLINISSFVEAYGWVDGARVRLLIIDVAGGPIGLEIATDASRFDQYWSEVAEPILTSIEFTNG